MSLSEREADKPCIFCGNPGTELQADMEDPEEIIAIAESMESGGNI